MRIIRGVSRRHDTDVAGVLSWFAIHKDVDINHLVLKFNRNRSPSHRRCQSYNPGRIEHPTERKLRSRMSVNFLLTPHAEDFVGNGDMRDFVLTREVTVRALGE